VTGEEVLVTPVAGSSREEDHGDPLCEDLVNGHELDWTPG